jgi:hypothetical protein
VKKAPTRLTGTPDDTTELVAHLARLAAANRGWVNVHPEVEEDHEPSARNGMFAWMGSRSPKVALATWTAPEVRRGAVEPASIGVRNPGNTRVLPQLRDAGLDGPPGWRIVQDSVGRGLVLTVPADESPEVVVDWLLRATMALTPLSITGTWVADVHEGSDPR